MKVLLILCLLILSHLGTFLFGSQLEVEIPPESPPIEASTEENSPEIQEELFPFAQNHLYAIKYIGYNLSDFSETNLEAEDFFDLGGEEYFWIYPRYEGMTLEVHKNFLEDDSSRLVYSTSSARPLYIKGNESDIFPNITVKLWDNQGNSTEITPYISLRDGSFIANEQGFIISELET